MAGPAVDVDHPVRIRGATDLARSTSRRPDRARQAVGPFVSDPDRIAVVQVRAGRDRRSPISSPAVSMSLVTQPWRSDQRSWTGSKAFIIGVLPNDDARIPLERSLRQRRTLW
jgi:hypothetical protein